MSSSQNLGKAALEELVENFRMLAANPSQMIRELWASSFPKPTPRPTTQFKPLSDLAAESCESTKASTGHVQLKPVMKLASPVDRDASPVTNCANKASAPRSCGINVREWQKPDGGTRTEKTVYLLSALDTISFDPFIAKAEVSHEASVAGGLPGLWRAKGEAWMEERATEATIRKLKSHQAILQEQQKTVEAAHSLRRAILNGDQETGEQKRQVAPANQIQALLSAPSPLRPNITDEQVEAAAIRALLDGATTEQDWLPYRQALSQHWPPYAVQEVEDRLGELWRINPNGPQYH